MSKKVKTQVALAETLGVSPRQVGTWRRNGWLGYDENDWIDVAATASMVYQSRESSGAGARIGEADPVSEWLKKNQATTADDIGDYQAARTRREIAQADRAELQAAQLRGELVPLVDVEILYTQKMTEVKAAIMGVPARAAKLLLNLDDVHEIRRILSREIMLALQGVSDEPPRI